MNFANQQKGFSLVIALLLLSTLTIIGLAIMRSGVLSEKQAVNIQEKSVSFHGAQTSNNGVIESYRYDQSVLSSTLDAGATGIDTCVDNTGTVTTNCQTPKSIDASNGVLKALTGTIYKECLTALKCSGNSAGMFGQNSVGCNVFQHKGYGWVDVDGDNVEDANEARTEIEQWTLLVSACAKG